MSVKRPVPTPEDLEKQLRENYYMPHFADAVAALRERVKVLERAIEAHLSGPGWGHNHWDATMKHGAGCNMCIEQREAKERLRAALSPADPHVADGDYAAEVRFKPAESGEVRP